MKRVLKVYCNRVSGVFALGFLVLSSMLFLPPAINPFVLIWGACIICGGGAYVTEKMNLTAGERLLLKKMGFSL